MTTTAKHLLPTSCYVCGRTEWHATSVGHKFWTNADAEIQFAVEDRRLNSSRYQ